MNAAVVRTGSNQIAAVLVDAANALASAGVACARLDAEVLLCAAAGLNRVALFSRPDALLSSAALTAFAEMVKRRAAREPVAYITGRKEFWSLDFEVTPAVLIPRPETEVLVEIALAILRSSQSSRHNVCDVGTGSGCIAVSIAYELASAHLIATDVSLDALQVARRNARQHAVQDRVNLIAADLLPFSSRPRFDLVVSNPPYVAAPSIGSLEPELRFEPRAALDGGVDGLDTIRRLLAQARAVLISNGWLVMEIGADQSHAAQELAVANNFVNVDVRADYAGLPRVLVAQAS